VFVALKNEIDKMNKGCESGRQNYDYLVSILFKKMPTPEMIYSLEKAGYQFKKLTKNPHW
jgi:hypothetical protein